MLTLVTILHLCLNLGQAIEKQRNINSKFRKSFYTLGHFSWVVLGCLAVTLEFYHGRIAELLLKKGCDVEGRNDDSTPLINATKTCSVDLIDLLLKNGADPNRS